MKKVISYKLWVMVFFVFLFLTQHYCYGQPVSSAELISNAKLYDGKVVAYEGEVIGEIMARGGYAWININDGRNAVGIWMDKDKTLDILYTGSFKSKGDWIEVTGVFQRACPQHGGDLDIHAQNIREMSAGRKIQERPNPGKRNFALVLLGILGALWILRQLQPK